MVISRRYFSVYRIFLYIIDLCIIGCLKLFWKINLPTWSFSSLHYTLEIHRKTKCCTIMTFSSATFWLNERWQMTLPRPLDYLHMEKEYSTNIILAYGERLYYKHNTCIWRKIISQTQYRCTIFTKSITSII